MFSVRARCQRALDDAEKDVPRLGSAGEAKPFLCIELIHRSVRIAGRYLPNIPIRLGQLDRDTLQCDFGVVSPKVDVCELILYVEGRNSTDME